MTWTGNPGTWVSGLTADDATAVAGLAARAAAEDGVPPLSGHILAALAEGADDYLLAGVDGRLVGAVVAHAGDPAELFVAPADRRRGHGAALVRAALMRSGAVWAHGDLPPAQALAAALRLKRTRELLQMRRPLTQDWAADQLRASRLPDGVRLRTFVPGQDERQFLQVNARAFSWHPEQGRLDLAGLQSDMRQPWFDPAGFFLAVDADDRVLGFHWTKVHRDGSVPLGEVYVLGVDPAATVAGARVRGLGTPLTAAGLWYLADRGLRTVLLYVEGDNAKALTLYGRLGFQPFATDVVYCHAQ